MQDDLYLINQIKEKQDPDAAQELSARHSGIYVSMVQRYLPSDTFAKRDALDEKDSRIYEAALDFDSDKSNGAKFSTFLANTVKWRCLNQVNRRKKFPEIPFEAPHDSTHGDFLESCMSEEEVAMVYQQANECSDKRVKKIIDMRYKKTDNKEDRSWKKIAKKLGMSVQGVINIHNKFIKQATQRIHV